MIPAFPNGVFSPLFCNQYKPLKVKSQNDFSNRRIFAVHKIKGFLCLDQRKGVGDGAGQVQLSFPKHVDRFSEHLVLKPGAPHIQLFGGDEELVYLRARSGKAHGDDTPGISGRLKEHQQRTFYAGCINGYGGTPSVGVFQYLCLKILFQNIDRIACTGFLCLFQLFVYNVRYDDVIAELPCDS